MDRLWTPWRYQYISKSGPSTGCIFCEKSDPARSSDNLVVRRGEHCYALLNLFPYTSGHLMIAPYQHVSSLAACDEAAAAEMMTFMRQAEQVLRSVYRPDGLNLGMNLGLCAGAGVADHIHMHVLPRWAGDANFMTTVAETRILPETLESTLDRVRAAWSLLFPEPVS